MPGSAAYPRAPGPDGDGGRGLSAATGQLPVRIDGDPNRRREWFFYRDEVIISDA